MINEPIFEIKEEEAKKDYIKFVVSPLEQGFGNTIGNALRRVLLSSIPGAAVTNVRIQGVRHQFSTLKGMKEDIVEFLLNLKKVRLIYNGEKPAKLSISAVGPREVKASDIQGEASVKIVNGDLILANLAKDTKLEAKMEAEVGVGYSPSEDRATNEIGLIPLDAAFSPITRINYRIEETRVGRYTNYDKLIFEVWTDGTFDPKKALTTASEILVKYFNQVISPKKIEKKEEEKKDELGPVGKLSVEEIGLPTRVANALVKAGYETIEDLVAANREELVKVRNLGEKSVKIIEAALGEKGLKFIEK